MKTILESKLGFIVGIGAFSASFVMMESTSKARYEAYKLALALHERFPTCDAEVLTEQTLIQGTPVRLRVNFDALDDANWAEIKTFIQEYTK